MPLGICWVSRLAGSDGSKARLKVRVDEGLPAVTEGLGGPPEAGLFVRRLGSGRPLVLLHGLPVSGEMFAGVAGWWSAHHQVIIPDLRGHGRSAGVPGPYSVEQLAADVVDVLDRMRILHADVLGYSQGGAVAQQLARDHPHRIDRLVLACTYARNRITRRERIEARVSSPLLATLGPRRLAELVLRGGVGPPLSTGDVAALRRMLGANTRRHALAAHHAMMDFDSRSWLDQIYAPTLVVCGSADTEVPARHSYLLALGIPNAELARITGAGHALLWTHTPQFVGTIDAWLSRPTQTQDLSVSFQNL